MLPQHVINCTQYFLVILKRALHNDLINVVRNNSQSLSSRQESNIRQIGSAPTIVTMNILTDRITKLIRQFLRNYVNLAQRNPTGAPALYSMFTFGGSRVEM